MCCTVKRAAKPAHVLQLGNVHEVIAEVVLRCGVQAQAQSSRYEVVEKIFSERRLHYADGLL